MTSISSLLKISRWALGALLVLGATAISAQGNASKGEYIASAAGCLGCHTASKAGSVAFAGTRALETPFGVFYGPNITPDKETGLGNWTEAEFKRALRHGERRDGSNYFPAFPYPSFTGMSDADMQDLWAYLKTLPATRQVNREHELRFPYNLRILVSAWKLMFFSPGTGIATAPVAPPEARGAYLVNALGHCGECHTPRNALGGPDKAHLFAGAKIPEGKVPNLTPTRLKKWSDSDLKEYFTSGTAPNGDVAVEPMSEVITNSTSKLNPADLAAVVAYLRTLPAQDEAK